MKRRVIDIKRSQDGVRLDIALMQADLGLSRRKVRAVIDIGGVYVNKKRVRVASRTVHEGDKVEIEYSPDALQSVKHVQYAFNDKDILYADHGIIAVNKPPGLPTQATRQQAVMHVIPCLEDYLKKAGKEVPKLALVHRLDMETSGVLLVAATAEATAWLTDLLKERKMKKTYHAVCHGVPREDRFKVECQLSAIMPNIGKVRIRERGGKDSLTFFQVLARNVAHKLALIQCEPVTGRTHQIRVHLESKGFPIVGDKKYGAQRAPLKEELAQIASAHQLLHAYSLTFAPAPGAKAVTVCAPYPEAMAKMVEAAGLS